ncbi:unnamed protein product [Heligmosomoides polygyrus]|uniref:Secreted RxLR effector peptide protein n=1 Tax=Heligmosomoides polygyrus TaxID=6339 RepID=A0A183GA45_HELPZ|nr:unnamed protein product [Heligmosomoides polygyrus]
MSLLRCAALLAVVAVAALPSCILAYSLRDDDTRLDDVIAEATATSMTRRRRAAAASDDQRRLMGLTEEQHRTVQYYLNKLKELGRERHPEGDKKVILIFFRVGGDR